MRFIGRRKRKKMLGGCQPYHPLTVVLFVSIPSSSGISEHKLRPRRWCTDIVLHCRRLVELLLDRAASTRVGQGGAVLELYGEHGRCGKKLNGQCRRNTSSTMRPLKLRLSQFWLHKLALRAAPLFPARIALSPTSSSASKACLPTGR